MATVEKTPHESTRIERTALSTKSHGAAQPWYKDAIIYQLHVRAFRDGNNDGIGDFRGLTERLDYIQDLGVTAIWLQPFFPSPLKDDGYDIADYMNVNPQYGTLDDFREFLDEAHRRDLKVISELVMNHTSDQHAWFQRSRRAGRFRLAKLVRVERHARQVSAKCESSFRTSSRPIGAGTRSPAPTTGTASSVISPI